MSEETKNLKKQHREDIVKSLRKVGIELKYPNKLTYKDLDDLEQELLHLIVPEGLSPLPVVCYDGTGNIVVANVIWVENDEIQSHVGFATKRRGDIFNYRVGQIISLVDAVYDFDERNCCEDINKIVDKL